MDVDVNALVDQLGRQLGAQAVEITALRLQLDAANAEVTRLKGEAIDAGGKP